MRISDLKILRIVVGRMTDELLAATGIPFNETTELQRQLLATFAFGMTYAAGRLAELTTAEIYTLSIGMLMDGFKYSDHQALSFAQLLVASASGCGNPVMQAVIHRGIDGHLQWQSKQLTELRTNVESVFKTAGA